MHTCENITDGSGDAMRKQTAAQYLREARLETAKRLVKQGELKCKACGSTADVSVDIESDKPGTGKCYSCRVKSLERKQLRALRKKAKEDHRRLF